MPATRRVDRGNEHALDDDPFIVPDYAHSRVEHRLIAVGKNHSGRPIFVTFTLRMIDDRELVRPISARYMHKEEIEKYEQDRRQEGSGLED